LENIDTPLRFRAIYHPDADNHALDRAWLRTWRIVGNSFRRTRTWPAQAIDKRMRLVQIVQTPKGEFYFAGSGRAGL
jgi:hypothetical protein